MSNPSLASLAALASAAAFAGSSIIWQSLRQQVSAIWMNAFKNTICLFVFIFVVCLQSSSITSPGTDVLILLAISGILGLTVGDFFLIKSYLIIGPARTFMISSFQPLFMALLSYMFLSQSLTWAQGLGVLAMMGCVLTLALEIIKKESRSGLKGLYFSWAFMILDGLGMFISRLAFERAPELNLMQANVYRCLAAALGFILLSRFFAIDFKQSWQQLSRRSKKLAVIAALLGTFVGLHFRLYAVAHGHLATVTAIAGCTPLIAAAMESLLITRKAPSRYFWVASGFFMIGLLGFWKIS